MSPGSRVQSERAKNGVSPVDPNPPAIRMTEHRASRLATTSGKVDGPKICSPGLGRCHAPTPTVMARSRNRTPPVTSLIFMRSPLGRDAGSSTEIRLLPASRLEAPALPDVEDCLLTQLQSEIGHDLAVVLMLLREEGLKGLAFLEGVAKA